MTRTATRGIAAVATFLVLAGCGGGGGGSSPPPAAPTPPAPDSTPDAFSFADRTDGVRGAATTSAAVTIAGINAPAAVSVTGGEYSIAGGAYTSAAGSLTNGAVVTVRVTASTTPGGVVEAALTVGGVAAAFRVTTSADVTPPTAAIVFPPPVARTSGNFITVRGTAADASGPLAEVRVNGLAATSTDGFATWTAVVPLPQPGSVHTLTVSAEDGFLNVANAAAQVAVQRSPRLGAPASFAIEPLNHRAYIVDASADAVVMVNLATGVRTWFAETAAPGNSRKNSLSAAVINQPSMNRLLVLDSFEESIVGIDWVTKERYVVSGMLTHGGVNRFGSATDFVLDYGNDRLLVTRNSPQPGIIAVSLTSGARTVWSDATTPNGANMFAQARALALDTAHNRLLVTDPSTNTIYGASLTDGSRTVVSSNTFPNASEPFESVIAIAVDPSGTRAFVPQLFGRVLAVDLASGARSVFSPGSGPDQMIFHVTDLEVDAAGGRLLLLDAYKRGLAAISLANGAQSIVSAQEAPGNVGLTQPSGMALDLAGSRLLVAEESLNAVVGIDLASAVGTVVVDGTTGNPQFAGPGALVLDAALNRLFIMQSGRVNGYPPSIVAANLATGSRFVVSGPAYPDALLPLTAPMDMALDTTRGRLLVTERYDRHVKAVDVFSGVRSIVSSNSFPDAANPFATPLGIVVDAGNDRALVASSGFGPGSSVLAVSLATGFRSVLAANASGVLTGPTLVALDAAHNRALVADQLRQSLYSVDLTTGAISELTNPADPDNPIDTPYALAYDPAKQIAYVLEGNFGAVLAVDVVTGRRVFLSR